MALPACTTYRSIFDLCHQDEAVGLKEVTTVQPVVPPDPSSDSNKEVDLCPEDGTQEGRSLVREVPDLMVCTACRSSFNNREEQMEHYKLDWHRFNLRQKMMGLLPVTVDEFEKKTGTGDMSSISGSESDSGDEEDTEDSDSDWPGGSNDVTRTDNEGDLLVDSVPHRLSNKVVFQDLEGHYLAVYRCVLQGKSDDEVDRTASLRTISNKTIWVVLMTGGGHFAGAVFKGKEVLQHKTFHRYTVRAKRGTAQGLRDAQNRSHAPKSAGAALRRYNEGALVKEIQDLLESWAEHINEASAIFLRAPSYNKSIFFGGRAAPLAKKDPRIRILPFATRRATFREVKRVHEVLSTVHVYGKDMDISVIFSPSKKVWKRAKKSTAEPESVPEKEIGGSSSSGGGDDDDSGDIQLETVEMTLGTLDLREFEIQPSRHRRRRKKKESGRKMETESLNADEGHEQVVEEEEELGASSTDDLSQEKLAKNKRRRRVQKKKKHPAEEVDESWEYGLRDALYTACKIGDVESLRSLLNLAAEEETAGKESAGELGRNSSRQQQSPDGDFGPLHLLNKPVDSTGFTLLHVASAAGQKAVVRLLMDVGADPASRDNKGQTPYVVAPEKEIRNVFRKYMGENPDKYDYSKAQIPGPLNAEIESKQMEKKKAQKAAKKQREKEQKEEKRKQEFEVEEKKRFASLTDREKRALAAERRLAEHAAATGVTVSNVKRCWTCGESLLGKIPFQYLDYSFCTTRCVQAHRKANTPAAKT